MDVALLKMDESSNPTPRAQSASPMADSKEIMRMLSESSSHVFGSMDRSSPKSQLERILGEAASSATFAFDSSVFNDISSFTTLRNSSKTLKCPKCNWHYKYQETLEIHMKDKHSDADVKCVYCADNLQHPKLARGETYSCGYKPYRCDLCRYSTTTKGNLSIHMQSDKHLHAVQELPNSIVEIAKKSMFNLSNSICGHFSGFVEYSICAHFMIECSIWLAECSYETKEALQNSPIDETDSNLVCLICGVFSSESLTEMLEHVEKDRSRPNHGDVSIVNGCFRCHLCPYNTTLKANFQLHTRTDKHLQKIQTANHLREGSRPHTAIYRLATTKTCVQVLCRQCHEVISSLEALREHCHVSSSTGNGNGIGIGQHQHQHNNKSAQIVKTWRCKICSVEVETLDAATEFAMVDDAAYACAGCGFTTKEVADLEEHAKSHEEERDSASPGQQKKSSSCSVCIDLEKHLISDHQISGSTIEKLLLVENKESSSSDNDFQHRCAKCPMAFRSDSQLKSHIVEHVFTTHQSCPTCAQSFDDSESLMAHMMEHSNEFCDICSESFSSKEEFLNHLHTTRHLQHAKKHLENSTVDLNTQQFAAAVLGDNCEKSFRCHVCKQSYAQAASLDIHIRSVAHQTRMTRLPELVAGNEVDSEKPIVEQPGVSNPSIRQFIEQTAKQMTMNDVMSLLLRNESDENREEMNGLQMLTQIKVYGEEKITGLVAGLAAKIDKIAQLDDAKCADLARIDCATCGLQVSGILGINLHYEEAHSASIPNEVLKKFGERLLSALDDKLPTSPEAISENGSEDEPPARKRLKVEDAASAAAAAAAAGLPNIDMASQIAMFSQMMGFPFMGAQPPTTGAGGPFGLPQEMFNTMLNPAAAAAAAAAAANAANNSPAKRARTRITDDQLKILRQYFNINNSPTEAQVKEMSEKSGLPEKVIKHWFRNTLFKERQRDKDSPYNFNVPPQLGIDLDTYEKTGEAKVVSLSSESSMKRPKSEVNSARATPTTPSMTTSTAVDEKKEKSQQLNLQAMLSQIQHANTFPFLDATFMAAAAGGGPMAQIQPPQPQQTNATSSSGRRANRTRFTDYQLKTLQQFFDKQAYPKDDDLEVLSKKLQLSPRVIVVWFQNARQKARKIYENHPNHENSDRFVRTPGSNFQCKRCNQVFQRYYELIQHQQKKCYKDDGAALASDNKSVEESLSDEEKRQLLAQQQAAQLANFQPSDLLKLFGDPKSSNDVLLKMCESMSSASTSSFHKQCPFCTSNFREKSAMVEHLQQEHPQIMLITPIDVDMLPDISTTPEPGRDSIALDLSGSGIDMSRDSISTSPTRSDDDVVTEALDDSAFATFGIPVSGNPDCRSPANNKRYRTHLTPLQVQVMKNTFAEYKTPSMAECEMLGKEIGLHKRVVQVWFQNARAKERKTKGHGDEDFKSHQTSCEQCDKQFPTRLALQDHLFSKEHVTLLRSNLKKEGVSDVSTAIEPAAPERKSMKPSSSNIDLTAFPFNLMMAGGLPFLDVNLLGTPIAMLQIPDDVKTQITNDLANGKTSTVFSQDANTIESVREALPDDEKSNVEAIEKDVGWACPSCTNVFQEEKKLKEHQKTMQMCNSCDSMLTLTQIHYSCKLCTSLFCLKTDYLMHLTTFPHLQFKNAIQN
ncbi:unnamed protein product [Caenorhabditis bovis]|uniref:Uncharacterized protein n=1 Tax=Caenorhabditis bovis TaxID=2654633 RepID=A0A8S1EX39_9PELO|nr:unnamed protein product [Caenorhabditis bovis]